MRTSLLAKATTTTFWCVRANSCANQSFRPGVCLCLCCSTLRAPCTNSLRKYLFPRLLMPSSFFLPPLEFSPGTIPIQSDSARPFPKALPLPIAPIKAVAVTGPTPGISVSRWQASFSFAVFWMTRSICSMRAASCSSSNLSCANRTRNEPDNFNSASSRMRGSSASTWRRPLGMVSPRSRRRLRIWFTTAVRRITQRSRTRCRACRSNCSSVLIGTKRILGRCTASAIASASRKSLLLVCTYRMLLDGVQDYAIFMMDPRGQIVSWNAGAERIKGYTADQIIGHSFSCFFPPEDIERGRPEEVLRITAASGRHEEQGMRVRKDGSQFLASVTFTALHDPAGNLRGFSEISHDLRESKESEAKYRGLLEAAPDAMVVVNQRGEITLLNVQAEKQFGYRRDELVGQKVKNIIPEGFAERLIADSLRSAEDALAQQIGTGIELNGKRKDGSEFPIEIMLSPLESAEGILVTAAIRDITTRKKAEAQMIHASEHDFLTGLPNRMLLNDRVNQAIRLSERYRRKLAVLFLDLDGFKHINDSLGHPAGDKLLQSVAKRLVDCVRGSDTVSRQGGDEFVVLLSTVDHPAAAAMTVRRMLQAVAEAHSIDQHDLHVTSCVGVSVYPNDGLDAETLIKNADTAMYQAKENGPQTYQFFKSAMNVRAVERQGIEESLRRALERKEFALHYQPKINLRTGETAGAEALIRWTHPTRGRVSPAQFIPVAEDCGLILPIGNWVLREACQQARAWLDAGLPLGTMAVNISAMQLRDKNFLEGVFAILKDTGLDPRSLELELTESILMKHAESTASILKSLRSSGVQLAVDDFGTGYSSLSYLRKFPIDALKIDQSFVRQITTIPDETIIVEAVISMGRSLKLRVVAEGVETQEQLAFLQAHQCDEAQGYYFSRPLLPHQFANMLENQLAGSREVRFWTSV